MFLSESTTATTPADNSGFTGEDHELAELTLEHARDLHNLNMSLVKLEHTAIVKENAQLMTEGVKEFFAKIWAKIKEYWGKFVAWLKAMVDTLVNKVFGPRKKWLESNKAKLEKKSDFGDAKVTLDERLLKTNWSSLVSLVEQTSEKALADTDKAASTEEVRKAVYAQIKGNPEKDSIGGSIRKSLLGEKTEEQKLESGLVKKLVTIAEATFASAPKFKELEKIARHALAIAESAVKLADKDNGKSETASKQIKTLQGAGPLISQLVMGAKAANDRANSQSMSALVKALHSGKTNESATPAGKGGVLAQFA